VESFAEAGECYEMGGVEFECVFGDVYFEDCLGGVFVLLSLVLGVGVGGDVGGAVVGSCRHGHKMMLFLL